MITITRQQLIDDPANNVHIRTYGSPTESVARTINEIANVIINTRCDTVPQAGDTLRYTTRYGEYYHKAFFETWDSDERRLTFCQEPYTPWASYDDQRLTFSTSGGPWGGFVLDELKQLTYVGKEERTFCVWGTGFPAVDGAIYFKVPVNVWEYADPDPLYPGYSTKTHERYTLTVRDEPSDFGYRYSISGYGGSSQAAFTCKEDYLDWLDSLHGVEFDSPAYPQNKTIFTYKKKQYLISREKWDELPYLLSKLFINGSYVDTKVFVDHANTTIHEYRYENSSLR